MKVLGFEDESSLRPDDKLPFDGAFVRAGATQVQKGLRSRAQESGVQAQRSGERCRPSGFATVQSICCLVLLLLQQYFSVWPSECCFLCSGSRTGWLCGIFLESLI